MSKLTIRKKEDISREALSSSDYEYMLNGVDIGPHLKGLTLHFTPGEFPKCTLDMIIPVDFEGEVDGGTNDDNIGFVSEMVVQLVIDLALFHRTEEPNVMLDIKSAVFGDLKVLLKYGIIISDTMVEQNAISLGMWDGVGTISAHARVASVLALIMIKAADVHGEEARMASSDLSLSRTLKGEEPLNSKDVEEWLRIACGLTKP